MGGSLDPAFVTSGRSLPNGSLPSGTVTFLFTDIEGSTVRWERDREAMQAAVRRHDALLHEVLAAHGGRVFKTIGDAFCAAFSPGLAALEAAADIQRRLAAEDWSAVDGLSVRIAIHAGDADERDGDYFGPTLNRVARLLATAHGGQIVVSKRAASLVESSLPESLCFRDLGFHRLRDLRQPEHVFQLVALGLTSDFQPLRSAGSKGNLRQAQRTFIGRSNDLANLRQLLETSNLVSIVGMGGVGKTRLALEVAASVDEAFESSWFVDLAPIADPSLVAPTILSTLEMKVADGSDPLEVLIDALRNRQRLLIFDNCEHLVAEVARVARAVYAACGDVTMLATSREALNVAGERIYRLAPLDRSAAVELFAVRAAAANAGFVLSPANRATVDAICARVDGIALAIELAAARVRAISVEELLRRLDERFRVLAGGNRSNLPHHQTMRALVDWSYELLSPQERSVFARLSSFAGRFTLEAVTYVCADAELDEWNVLDALTGLVDKSLVVADVENTAQHYRMLATLADYARERLIASGESDAIASRHASYYAGLAESAYAEWDTAPAPDWLKRLAPELDNFRCALAFALKSARDVPDGARIAANVMPLFMRLSLLAEGIEWCLLALAREPAPAPPLRAKLHYVISMLYNNQLAFKAAFASAAHAVALYENLDDDRALARALSQLAQQCARQGRRDEAALHAENALLRARNLNDTRLLAGISQRCATVFEPQDIESARARFAESVALFRTLGRDDETSRALVWWGAAEADARCYERALKLSVEALELESGDARLFVLINVAAYALVLDRDSEAYSAAREAFSLAAEARHPVLLPVALSYLAALSATTNPALATELFAYAQARLSALDWSDATDAAIHKKLLAILETRFDEAERRLLFAQGEGWSEERAVLSGWSV